MRRPPRPRFVHVHRRDVTEDGLYNRPCRFDCILPDEQQLITVHCVRQQALVRLILVTALLVIPGATARFLTSNIVVLIPLSIAIGVLGVALGLTVAYLANVSPGASIVLVLFVGFLSAFLVSGRGA